MDEFVKKYKIFITLTMLGFMFIASFTSISKKNSAPFVIDILEYQSIGVNFAYGHGLQKFGGLESFDTYKFDIYENNDALPTSNMLFQLFVKYPGMPHFYMDPGYPLFLGIIYRTVGVNPYYVKLIQLLLLCIVSSGMSLIGYKYWKTKGFILGIIAGFILLYNNIQFADVLMTEILNLFSFFLVILSYTQIHSKSILKATMPLAFSLAFAILIKGVAILIPLFLIGTLFIKGVLSKKDQLFHKSIITSVFLILFISPWIVYSNLTNSQINFDKETFIQDVLNADYCQECEEYISNSLLEENEKEYIITHNFNLQKEPVLGVDSIYEFDFFIVDLFAKIYDSRTLFFLTKKHTDLLLSTNNEYLTNPDFRPHLWNQLEDSYYLNDGLEDFPDIVRVSLFYLKNPSYFFANMTNKILYFIKTPALLTYFFILFFVVSYAELFIIKRIKKKSVIIPVISLNLLLAIFVVPLSKVYLKTFAEPALIPILLFVGVNFIIALFISFRFKLNTSDFLKSIPTSFYSIFFNLLFVALLVVSIDRFTNLLNLVSILVSLIFTSNLIENFIRKSTSNPK